MQGVQRLVLVGFSGTGKTTVARLVAERLGWRLADTDEAIERAFGMSVPKIFDREGEAAFRAAERRALTAALAGERIVIATGGGAVVLPEVWSVDTLGQPGTLVVALDARPATSFERLRTQHATEGATVERPMLAGNDPLARIGSLKAERQGAYDRAAITLVVDDVDVSTVSDEVVQLVSTGNVSAPDVELGASSGSSAIFVRSGMLAALGESMRAVWPRAERAWVVSDDVVAGLHGEAALRAISSSGYDAQLRTVAAGEGSKSLGVVGGLYDWLLDRGVERGDVVVALGGGMVGDVAGFVAATCLRGLGLVQVPTSLLAMVDSSVGGKTGINHGAGKNLIGSFYQAPLVVIDPSLLSTLPMRELTSGWAEIVKHAVIQRSTPGGERADLLTFLERNVAHLRRLEEPALSYLIRRNVALKAAVVAADEREAGVRAQLNFGHTLGHGIEAAGYALLHGEAIAIGMRAAARIGQRLATCGAEEVARVETLLDRFGLPREATIDADRVLRLMGNDKKRVAGKQRWLLPVVHGGVEIRDDVPMSDVEWALDSVSAGEVAHAK